MDDPPANKNISCKDIDNYQCAALEQVFQVSFTKVLELNILRFSSLSVRMASVRTSLACTVASSRVSTMTALIVVIVETVLT